MAGKRMIVELGMGTDIRGGDSTKAAVRALREVDAALAQVDRAAGAAAREEGALQLARVPGVGLVGDDRYH